MGKNAITVLNEGLKLVSQMNAELKNVNGLILSLNNSAQQTSKSFTSINTPKGLTKTLNNHKVSIAGLNDVLKEQARLENALHNQLIKNSQARTQISKDLAKARFEQQQINRSNKEAAVLSSKLSTEYQKQSVILNRLRKRYKDLALTEGESSKEAKRLLANITALDNRLKRVDANVGQFQRSVGNYSKAMRGAMGAARGLAGAMGLLGGAFLVVRVFRDAFNRMRTFDKEMQNMAGILRTTRPELKELEQTIINVAAGSVKTSTAVAELATALITLGKTKEEVLDLLSPVNDLSIALQSTSDETGKFLVQSLNAFQKTSESAAEFADTIAAIRASTSLDFQKMRDSFQYITPIANILGKDLAWTGATVGLLADNGLKAEQSGRLLATALIRLSKNGKTLTGALDEINTAYKEGVDGNKLLQMAGVDFGAQAAKVAVILATQGEKLELYEKRIREAAGSLDDLVNEQLKSVDAQLQITTSEWERMVLSIEDGTGSISDALSASLGFLNNVLKGITLLNKSEADRLKMIYDDKYTEHFKIQTKGYITLGDMAKQQAIKDADHARDRVDHYNAEIKKLKERNEEIENDKFGVNFRKSSSLILPGIVSRTSPEINENNELILDYTKTLAKMTAELNAAENVIVEITDAQREKNRVDAAALVSDNKTIASLRELISLENEFIENTSIETELGLELIAASQERVKGWKAEIAAILGINNARKQGIKAIKGSLAYMEQEVSKLKEKQSKLATTSQEYYDQEKAIRKAEEAVKDFKEEVHNLILELDGVSVLNSVGDFESAYKRIQDIIKDKDFGKIKGVENKEGIKLLEKHLREEQELELEIAKETAKLKKDLQRDTADAISNITNSIFDGRIMRYEEDVQKNNDYYAKLLDNEELSEQQRDAMEAQREAKNAEIEKKKREVQRKAAIFNKAFALTEVVVDTAKQVAAATATVKLITARAALNPLLAPLIPLAAAQIPLILASGTLAAGAIAAQPIPQYEKGKGDYDNYEGSAIWGEKRREVKISKDGSMELSPKKIGNHLTHVKKDDIIHPDASKFLSSLSDEQLYNDLHKHSIMASLQGQSNSINSYLMTKSINEQTDRLVRALERNKPKVNIHNNINSSIGDDINFLMRKQNSL